MGQYGAAALPVLAYLKKEIHTIKYRGVFCIDKAGFLRLGHNYYQSISPTCFSHFLHHYSCGYHLCGNNYG